MSGNNVALDTNQAIAILNDDVAAVTFYSAFDQLVLPVTVIGELRYGATNSKRADANLKKIDELVARCTVIDTTLITAITYAKLRFALKQIGHPVPENDLWIAAVCVQHALPLATRDHHFNAIQGLVLAGPPTP